MTTKIDKKGKVKGMVARRLLAKSKVTGRVYTQQVVYSRGAFVQIMNPVTGKLIRIPKKSLPQLSALLQQLERGNDVQVVSADKSITTQQAADILNVSRPFIVKLIESGKIPHEIVGKRHRRLFLKDVMALKERMKTQQLEGLRQLAAEAQDLRLGY